jgi:uncharacterized protein (DUF58 family)
MIGVQIAKAYDEGSSLDELVETFGYDAEQVKQILIQFSSRYRSEVKRETIGTDFTEDDLALATNAVKEIMQSTDDDYLRFRCARYLRDDKKGRLDALKGLGSLKIDVQTINIALRQAHQAKLATNSEKPVIELEEVTADK